MARGRSFDCYNFCQGLCIPLGLLVFASALLFFLIFYLIISPIIFEQHDPKFYVDDVSLTQFTLSASNNLTVANVTLQNPPNALNYDLSLNMTFRNPNRFIRINFDKIEANVIYHGHSFAINEGIQGFNVGFKTEKHKVLVFEGEQLVSYNDEDKLRYDSESKDDHVYKIDLKLRFNMKYKLFWEKHYRHHVDCDLKVPLSKVSSAKFERTKCYFDYDRPKNEMIEETFL